MHILVSNFKDNKPVNIKGNNLDNWVFNELKDLNFKTINLDFSLSLEKNGDFIQILGKITGDFYLTCVRCLEDIKHSLNEDFKVYLYNEGIKANNATEIELNNNDLDFVFIEDNEIYPAKIIREQLILSLPDYPVCNAKCHCSSKKDSIIKNANLN